jgi:general secretion pathway protein K
MIMRRSERGVALVVVLGVVALVAAWASTAAYEDMISLRRAENLQQSSKAWLASESAMEVARLYLKEDAKNNQSDHLDEDWAMPIPPLPIDDGLVSGEIVDANRFYNVNDLIDPNGKVDPVEMNVARKLFLSLDLKTELVDKLVDWMDTDDQAISASGAEDYRYYDKPYKVKNAPLDRWQELSLIEGFDADVLKALRDVVIVRPVGSGKSTVNINTASAEVLMALFPAITQSDAETLIAGRPYETMPTLGQWAAGPNVARLSKSSDAFIVRTDAQFGRARWREEYLLTRTADGKTAISYRERQAWMR